MTVSWIFEDILQKNHAQCNEDLPRVVKVCKTCWDALENKPHFDNYYWTYDHSI